MGGGGESAEGSAPLINNFTQEEMRVRRTGGLAQPDRATEEEARNGSTALQRHPFLKDRRWRPYILTTPQRLPPQKQRTGLGIREGDGRPSCPVRSTSFFPTLSTTLSRTPQAPGLQAAGCQGERTFGIYDSHSRMVQTPSKSSGTVTWETPLVCMICTPPSWLLDV